MVGPLQERWEVGLLAPHEDRAPDELGFRLEEHARVVERVDAPGADRLSDVVLQQLGEGDGPGEITLQDRLADRGIELEGGIGRPRAEHGAAHLHVLATARVADAGVSRVGRCGGRGRPGGPRGAARHLASTGRCVRATGDASAARGARGHSCVRGSGTRAAARRDGKTEKDRAGCTDVPRRQSGSHARSYHLIQRPCMTLPGDFAGTAAPHKVTTDEWRSPTRALEPW
jgi:hypothetical protein